MGIVVSYTNTVGKELTLSKLNVIALEYIHSEADHVRWDQVNKSIMGKPSDPMEGVLNRYISHLRTQINVDTTGVDALSALDKNDFWVELMEGVAEQANAALEEFASANEAVTEGLNLASANKNFMQAGGSSQEFENFMNGMYKALSELSSLSPQQWNGFKAAYRLGISKSGRKAANELAFAEGIVKSWQLEQGQEIVNHITQLLLTAAKQKYTGRQLAGTLTHVKQATIAGVASIEEDLVPNIENLVEQSLGSKQIRSRPQFKTSKVDIFQTAGASLQQTTEKTGNMDYRITGILTTRVEGLKDIAAAKNATAQVSFDVSLVDLVHSSSYIDYLKRVFGSSSSEMYSVYNTLTFSEGEGEEYYRVIKNNVLRNSLEEFLAGKGQEYMQDLIFINGRVYSMASILYALTKDINNQRIILMDVTGTINKNGWVGSRKAPNLADAFARSQRQKASLNKLRLRVQMNPAALLADLNRLGVTPIQ